MTEKKAAAKKTAAPKDAEKPAAEEQEETAGRIQDMFQAPTQDDLNPAYAPPKE